VTPLSPELVLVAPADSAALARAALPAYPPFPPVHVTAAPARARVRFDRGFAAFCGVCIAATLVPFALAIAFGR
jgi:hypothetical protein